MIRPRIFESIWDAAFLDDVVTSHATALFRRKKTKNQLATILAIEAATQISSNVKCRAL